MNKKRPALASGGMASAMGKLSKAALIDLAIDLVRRMEGADQEETELLVALEEKYLPPVCFHRGDKVPKLLAAHDSFDRQLQTTQEPTP